MVANPQAFSPTSAGSGDFSSNPIVKQAGSALLTVVKTARAWLSGKSQYIFKWIVVGTGIGVVTCSASFGIAYLLSYYGAVEASAAVYAFGGPSIKSLLGAAILGPIRAFIRWHEQTELKEHLGEVPSLFLANVTSMIALFPVGKFPFGIGLLRTISSSLSALLPYVATYVPSLLSDVNLGGRRWIFAYLACQLLWSVITVCCFGVVRSGITMLVNMPTFIMFFVEYYFDKRFNSFIPSVCTNIGISFVSLACSFLL
jgi:hypothetical protein